MNYGRFDYDEDLVSTCASSRLAAFVTQSDLSLDTNPTNDEACLTLLGHHAFHYDRLFDSHDDKAMRTQIAALTKNQYVYTGTDTDTDTTGTHPLSARLRRFVSNTVFVHNHNHAKNNNARGVRHFVRLNQFSDLDDHQLPASNNTDLQVHVEATLDAARQGENNSLFLLDGKESLLKLAHFFPPIMAAHAKQKMDPNLLSNNKHTIINTTRGLQRTTLPSDPSRKNYFNRYVDWSTDHNPDGVRIVHPPSNQGMCGSCWTFTSTGTIEASVSRRAAYQAFMNATNHTLTKDPVTYDTAVKIAQAAEVEALATANLSIQELLDCDTGKDLGCIGGNPLLSFDWIHEYGLTSWENYPYEYRQKECKKDRVKRPIASVESWGVLNGGDEKNMELVLRYVGPMAVGLYATEPSFLMYSKGIYDIEVCGQEANHALLIVGMGEEIDPTDGKRIKYWKIRNSWGTEWGEGGFGRIKRYGGSTKNGVCGLAKGPSVALGGMLLPNAKFLGNQKYIPNMEPSCTGWDWYRYQCTSGLLHDYLFWIIFCFSVAIIIMIMIWEYGLTRVRGRQATSRSTPEEASSLLTDKNDTVSYGSN